MICNFQSCSICQCEEEEIPLPWKQESEYDDIDKNIDEKFYRWIEKYNYSSPMWIVENEIDSKNGIYVNLLKNQEAFTGYQGQHIWNAIYHENCFNNEIKSLDSMCKEDKTLYKIISGLHTNINIHLSKNYFDINSNSNQTIYNSTMLMERVVNQPDRLNNLFFLYSLLLKSFYKAENLLKEYNYFTGNEEEDIMIPNYFNDVFNKTEINGHDLCEDCLRKDLSASDDIENFDDFFNFNPIKLDQLKTRFRNISHIMDCVSCQKCKLHGKLQVYGLATMLKILFAKNLSHDISFKRNELISFVNLVGKVSKSIDYLYEHLKLKKVNSDATKGSGNLIYTVFFTISIWSLIIINIYLYKTSDARDKNKVDLEMKTKANMNSNIFKSDGRSETKKEK